MPSLTFDNATTVPVREFVALVAAGCMAHIDDPTGLRRWAAASRLPKLREETAAAFLRGAAGQAWAASVEGSRQAISSENDGACSVDAEKGDPLATQETLITMLKQSGVTVERRPAEISRDGLATLRSYAASLGTRRWRLRMWSRKNPEAIDDEPAMTVRVERQE